MATSQAKETYVRLRKERDFHRMHHKRVLQEKSKLIADLQRVQVRVEIIVRLCLIRKDSQRSLTDMMCERENYLHLFPFDRNK